VTRCGNLFGGGDLNYNRLIPGTIRSVLRGEAPVIRSDGQFIRDYVYVRDAVEAYLRLAELLPGAGITGEAFNIGPEAPLSVLEVVARLLAVMERSDLVPVVQNQATHEILRQSLDFSKASERLGWKPRHSLEEGLRETVAWYRAELGG
jgi:CDP-glucose 4,6-dehydratase